MILINDLYPGYVFFIDEDKKNNRIEVFSKKLNYKKMTPYFSTLKHYYRLKLKNKFGLYRQLSLAQITHEVLRLENRKIL